MIRVTDFFVIVMTLNALLVAEADRLCGAQRYEHSPDRVDTRAGHYERQLDTKAGEVTLQMPKLRSLRKRPVGCLVDGSEWWPLRGDL